jgi:hypothetical protein
VASRPIDRAYREAGWFACVRVVARMEAERARRGVARHVGPLGRLVMVDLTLSAVMTIAIEADRARAYARHAAARSAERPARASIATADPDPWKGEDLTLIDLTA